MEIASTIIALDHMLVFKALAEGVGTEEQWAFLREGCDAYQGYLKSKPVPADGVVKLLWSNEVGSWTSRNYPTFNTNLLNAGSTINVQTIIQNMPMVIIKPMLAMP